jgi:pimeloyl-ACP methyl ester carboxylesterase
LPPEEYEGVEQHIRFCTAPDGVRLAFATHGRGPVIVKAANWVTHLEHDWVSPVWRRWWSELGREHRVVRYDQRGCGLSDRDPPHLSLDAFVDDLAAVVDAAGLERFALIGISQGGAVATSYAVRHPERVSHLVVYGGYARGRRLRDLTPEQQAELDVLDGIVRVGWGRPDPVFRRVGDVEGRGQQVRVVDVGERVGLLVGVAQPSPGRGRRARPPGRAQRERVVGIAGAGALVDCRGFADLAPWWWTR